MVVEDKENAETIITKWGFQEGANYMKFSSMFREYPEDAKKLLKAIQEVHKTMYYLVKDDSSSEQLIRVQYFMELAMRRLEKEFHFILSKNKNILNLESISNQSSSISSTRTSVSDDIESTYNNRETEAENNVPNASIMDDLKTIAECMIASGYGKRCIDIYKLVRKSILDENLYNLGVLDAW